MSLPMEGAIFEDLIIIDKSSVAVPGLIMTDWGSHHVKLFSLF